MSKNIKKITVINNAGDFTIITDDKYEMTKSKELWLKMLAYKTFEDLEKVREEAVSEGLNDLVDCIDRLCEILNDEKFLAELEQKERDKSTANDNNDGYDDDAESADNNNELRGWVVQLKGADEEFHIRLF
ncbi:MAG: hypothetical protein FWG90_02025 [Oscillospiraceae bacterium]|nr:hypothetical protein [Oscillospiraceae bacterium]